MALRAELGAGYVPSSSSAVSMVSSASRACKSLGGASKTEFEHRSDGASARHLPKPGPGGFSRGSFIGWRRADRYPTAQGWRIDDFYELMHMVGEGGFGTVHAARHRRTGEVVAIKSLRKDRMVDRMADVEEALQLEVEFLEFADHPNVVRYYESFEDSDHLWLVMEMCSGGALSQHIKSAHECHGLGISEADLARIMAQILRSVAYCHAHSIVHRDLKPQNFLFGCGAPGKCSVIPIACSGDSDAPLKLVDFGISGVVRSDRPEKRLLTKRAGTSGYMAPEVHGGQPYGPKADIFSLGAVMHTMITGTPPAWDASKSAYHFPGRMRWRSLSDEGQALLTRLVHTDPAERPTASEAIADPWFRSMGASQLEGISSLYSSCIARIRRFACRSKLQRSIMYSMVAFAPLHNHYMEKLRTVFVAANRSALGALTRDEFTDIVRSEQLNVLGDDSQALFAVVNSSQTGYISYSEWLAATAPQAWYDTHEHLQRAFETLDVDRNGYIRGADLCRVLPGVFHPEEIDSEIRCINPGGQGWLAFDDFCALSSHEGRGKRAA